MDLEPYQSHIYRRFPDVLNQRQPISPILQGWDSIVLDIGGEYIFRFPRRPDVKLQMEKEACLLPKLAQALPVPIPQFEFVWLEDPDPTACFVGYRKLPGQPLTPKAMTTSQITRQLAGFLSKLHRFSSQPGACNLPAGTSQGWRQSYQKFFDWIRSEVFPLLAEGARLAATDLWQGFLNQEENFHFQPVLIHADLVWEHILFDPGRGCLTGVIDWGEAVIGDPALDFAGLFDIAGRDATEQVLCEYDGPVDQTFWQRIHFYRTILPFHSIRYGLLSGSKAHLKKGLQQLGETAREGRTG